MEEGKDIDRSGWMSPSDGGDERRSASEWVWSRSVWTYCLSHSACGGSSVVFQVLRGAATEETERKMVMTMMTMTFYDCSSLFESPSRIMCTFQMIIILANRRGWFGFNVTRRSGSIHPSVFQSIHQSIKRPSSSIYLSSIPACINHHPFLHQSIQSSIIPPSIHPSIHYPHQSSFLSSSFHPSLHSAFFPFINLSLWSITPLFIHPSILSSINLSIIILNSLCFHHSSIQPSINQSSIHPSLHPLFTLINHPFLRQSSI